MSSVKVPSPPADARVDMEESGVRDDVPTFLCGADALVSPVSLDLDETLLEKGTDRLIVDLRQLDTASTLHTDCSHALVEQFSLRLAERCHGKDPLIGMVGIKGNGVCL